MATAFLLNSAYADDPATVVLCIGALDDQAHPVFFVQRPLYLAAPGSHPGNTYLLQDDFGRERRGPDL